MRNNLVNYSVLVFFVLVVLLMVIFTLGTYLGFVPVTGLSHYQFVVFGSSALFFLGGVGSVVCAMAMAVPLRRKWALVFVGTGSILYSVASVSAILFESLSLIFRYIGLGIYPLLVLGTLLLLKGGSESPKSRLYWESVFVFLMLGLVVFGLNFFLLGPLFFSDPVFYLYAFLESLMLGAIYLLIRSEGDGVDNATILFVFALFCYVVADFFSVFMFLVPAFFGWNMAELFRLFAGTLFCLQISIIVFGDSVTPSY
jgi:hypothetical protein